MKRLAGQSFIKQAGKEETVMYRLTITKIEVNPNYEKEMENWERKMHYGNSPTDFPKFEFEQRSLFVILTEDEFRLLKPEILRVFDLRDKPSTVPSVNSGFDSP